MQSTTTAVLRQTLPTQIDIIQSERVAQKVVKKQRLDEQGSLRDKWEEETGRSVAFSIWLAKLLANGLTVDANRDSNAISIQYKSPDPAFSAAMANAFAESYAETALELRVSPAKGYSQWFDEQLAQSRERLAASYQRLAEYQQSKGLTRTQNQYDVETARLAELTSQLSAAQGAMALSQSSSAYLSDNPAVLGNPVVSSLRTSLVQAEAELQEVQATFGARHPRVLQTQSRIEELRTKLAIETQRQGSSLNTARNIDQARIAKLQADIAAQKAKLQSMRSESDQASIYQRDVDNNQRAYDQLLERRNQAILESQSTQPNVSILQNATPPTSPSSPKMVLAIGGAIVGGMALALSVLFGQEAYRRRIHCIEDVEQMIDLEVLGEIPLAQEKSRGDFLPALSRNDKASKKQLLLVNTDSTA